jgi:hypothetical protein
MYVCVGTEVKVLIMPFEKAQQLESTGEIDDDDLLELQVRERERRERERERERCIHNQIDG